MDILSLPVFKEPLCLIESGHEGTLCITTEVLEQITLLEKKLHIVTIVGLYRTGKSYLLNRLAGANRESKQIMTIATAMGSALVLLVSLVLVCCVLQRRKRKQYKKEQREKEYQELQEIERKKEYYGIAEEVYDQIKDEQDTYYIIHDNSLNANELKESEERYVKPGTAKTAETNESSSLSRALQDECISDGEKPDIPYRPITLPKVTIATDANPK